MDLWEAVHDERASALATFEGLSDEQWEVESLCGEWTVRDVLGHLIVATDPRLRNFFVPVVKERGNFDKANSRLAREQADRPTAELLERYRQRLSSRYSPPGFGPKASLGDVLLHGLDVRVPLGLPTERPAERWVIALDVMFSRAARALIPRGRPAVRWVATDHEWSHGSGDEVRGTMADLALAASGRGARVGELTGSGHPAVAAWLGS